MRPDDPPGYESLADMLGEGSPRLQRALERAARSNGSDTDDLQAIVSETVVRARLHRQTPEAVIIHFKRELELGPRYVMSRGDYSTLVERVVRWCIDVYYRE